MPDKAEVAALSAPAQGFCPNKVGIREISVIDDIRLAAHCAQLQKPAGPQNFLIEALVAFKAEFRLRIILVPGIAPADAGAFFEAEGHDLFHQRQETSPEPSRNGLRRLAMANFFHYMP